MFHLNCMHYRVAYVSVLTPSNRGSLFRLIHRPASGELLDQRRRLRMALDVVCGLSLYVNLLKYFFSESNMNKVSAFSWNRPRGSTTYTVLILL